MQKNKTGRNVTPIGECIRQQRSASGLTVKQLADRVGLSRNTITNYESGRTTPTAADLVKLAKALGCSLGTLLSTEDPKPVPRFAFRAHKALRKEPDLQVAAQRFFHAYQEIEEITGTRLVDRLPQLTLDGPTEPTDQYIAATATDLRGQCGLRDTGPENIVQVLEALGVRSLFFTTTVKGLDGISVRHGDLSMVLLHRRRTGIERTIFSAAHELGHLLLHPGLFSDQPSEDDDERDYEREANLFAGHFLVPSHELIRVWQEERLARLRPVYALIQLKRIFRVSFWCLLRRATEENLSQVSYAPLVAELKRFLGISGRAKMENLEPDPMPVDVLWKSTRFVRLIQSAYLQELIGVSKVAELMQTTVDEAKDLAAEWTVPRRELVG